MAKSNQYYFSHDFGARNDPKIQELLMDLGCEAIGVYWCIIEQLYEQGGRLSMVLCKSIAFALHVHQDLVQKVINDYDLFQNDGEFFWSNSVIDRISKIESLRDKRRSAAVQRWSGCKSNANASIFDAKAMQGAMQKKRKEKKIKKDISDDISKENAIAPSPPLPVYEPEEKIDLDLLKEKCLTSPIWFENAQRTLKKSGGEIFSLMNDFVSELKAGGRGGEKTDKDFKTHFINWAKLQKNGTIRQSKKQIADERDADLARQFATGTSLIDKTSDSEIVV